MNKNNGGISIVVIIILFLVAGVSATVWYKKPKAVDYYKKHQVEMERVHSECLNNPAELHDNGDCINSQEAKLQLIWEQGKKNSSSVMDAINKGF
jgi:hypothetical protein